MITANEPLIRQIVEYIENNPEEWHQRSYGTRTSCGTAHCIAGWALVFSEVPVRWSATSKPGVEHMISRESIEHKATELLGLTEDQANEIFFLGFKYNEYDGYGFIRQPSLAEMKDKITEITDIEFKEGH